MAADTGPGDIRPPTRCQNMHKHWSDQSKQNQQDALTIIHEYKPTTTLLQKSELTEFEVQKLHFWFFFTRPHCARWLMRIWRMVAWLFSGRWLMPIWRMVAWLFSGCVCMCTTLHNIQRAIQQNNIVHEVLLECPCGCKHHKHPVCPNINTSTCKTT